MQISEPAEYVLLALLKTRPMHGYEMYQHFESGTIGQIVHLEMSQMYAYLKKLERMAYIEAHLESQGARPPRKIFQLTTTGQTLLLQWLGQPVEKPRDIRLLFLIKLYFVRQFIPQQSRELLGRQIEACQRFLNNLEARSSTRTGISMLATRPAAPAETGSLDETFLDQVVLSSRIHQTRSLLEWLSELQAEFGELPE